jgi:hypothetical protein
MTTPTNLPLRNQILDACQRHSVNDAAATLVDCLMILLIASAPDIDACERAVIGVSTDMRSNVRRAFEEYHGMREAQQATRQ